MWPNIAWASEHVLRSEELTETAPSILWNSALNPGRSCRKQVEQDGIWSSTSHKNSGVILRTWSLWCGYCPALLVLSRRKQRGSAYQLFTCRVTSTLHCSETFWLDNITWLIGTESSGNKCLGVVYPRLVYLFSPLHKNRKGGPFVDMMPYIETCYISAGTRRQTWRDNDHESLCCIRRKVSDSVEHKRLIVNFTGSFHYEGWSSPPLFTPPSNLRVWEVKVSTNKCFRLISK